MDIIRPKDDKVMLSVLLLVYNHKKYIAKALDSVLEQCTQFSYEIIVHDDFSTDGTREILLDYKKKYPENIILIFEDENMYSKGWVELRKKYEKHLTGKYMILLEGDDYWLDRNKIEKQVSFLEKNMDFAGVAHASKHIIKDGKQWISPVDRKSGCYNIEELIDWENAFHTASFMFRTDYYLQMPRSIQNIINGDWVNAVWMASKGKIFYMDDVMTVHRVFTAGSFSEKYFSDNSKYENILNNRKKNCDLLNSALAYKYDDIFKLSMGRRWFGYYYEKCRYKEALRYWKSKVKEKKSYSILIRCFLLAYSPGVVFVLRKIKNYKKNFRR